MKTSEYWKERFVQLEQAQNQLGAAAYAEIEKHYRQAQRELDGQIRVWYQRLADNNEISLAEARRWLTADELAEFKWDVQEYIKRGTENAIDGQWTKQLENASAKFHISRLEALKIRTRQSMEQLFAKQQGIVGNTLGEVYRSGYYHTAFELQKGFAIGWDIAGIDQPQLEKVLAKPWAVDGRNFSERIWGNKDKLIAEVHTELTRSIMLGQDPQQAIDAIARKMNTSKTNAGRLVMTEEAYFSSLAQRDCFHDLGVEQFEIVATLDSHTSEICQEADGQVRPMSEFEPSVTAPPFHVNCRSTTVPYFDDDFGSIGERVARGEDGKTYYVPADMKYKDWRTAFVDSGDKAGLQELTKSSVDDKIKLKGEDMQLEYQRYGRNKATLINNSYIDSGEYRKKFDNMSYDVSVSRVLYTKAKEMLKHRSGTLFEDMCWVDSKTGLVVASALNEQIEESIVYTEMLKKAIANQQNLITMHTHPNSMPPSASDFNSMFKHGYQSSFVLCHDGKIFQYLANEEVNERLYGLYIQRFMADGLSDYAAQLKALERLKENYDIDFWEVKS